MAANAEKITSTITISAFQYLIGKLPPAIGCEPVADS